MWNSEIFSSQLRRPDYQRYQLRRPDRHPVDLLVNLRQPRRPRQPTCQPLSTPSTRRSSTTVSRPHRPDRQPRRPIVNLRQPPSTCLSTPSTPCL
jgi:hypothetical protein